jgi:FkbM family methyltransferase
MTAAASLVKRLAASLGVRITRQSAVNRFDAVDVCLLRMKALGYAPKVIIDGGANVGQFYRLVAPIFRDTHYHLIEPQPACAAAIRELAAARPETVECHSVAVSRPGVSSVRMTGCGSTGAYVANDDEPAEIEVPATTLDVLFRGKLGEEDRTLLKLDLESHEYPALEGAREILAVVEVVLVEVTFYDANDWGRTLFSDVFRFLGDANFELYDFASLASRSRDQRLCLGDVVFVRRCTPLLSDSTWG